MTSVQPDSTQQISEQPKSETGGTNETKKKKNESTKTKTLSAVTEGPVIRSMAESAKPPAGRSVGIITFIGPDDGIIEREDTQTFRFSFEAFFGNRKHLLPDVKVHFTAVKQVVGRECATDVKVAPGGTEHIGTTVYEGVVTKVIPDTYVLEPHPGQVKTILAEEPIKLPFGKMDTRVTLLLFDRVKFQVVRDLVSQIQRATNITPQMPQTIQLTKEVRLKGVIVSIKDDTYTIATNTYKNIPGFLNENLSDCELKVMDEVEFTTKTVNTGRINKVNAVHAIRIKKLLDVTVSCKSQEKTKPGEIAKGTSKWKPVVSEEVKVDSISSDTYNGKVLKVFPKSSTKLVEDPPNGLVSFTVDGTDKSLPFGLEDVFSQATMLIGDMVQFNIATNCETKKERAVNIKIQPETFETQLMEKRKSGVILKLNETNGIIRTQHEPVVMFDLSEVIDAELTLSEKVEFTVVLSAEGKRAIRVSKPTRCVLKPGPNVQEKKEKKITIKLQEQEEQIQNQVKDSENKDSHTVKAAIEVKQKEEKGHSRSQERNLLSQGSSCSDSDFHRRRRSSSRDRSYRSRRHSRSRSKDRSHRRSRSRSKDRSHRRSRSRSNDRSHRRSRSRSKERYNQIEQNRISNSDYRGEYHRKRQDSSPDLTFKGLDPFGSQIIEELAKKREELLQLNELIARKKAVIAMKEPDLFIDAPEELMYKYQSIPDAKSVKSILKKPLESFASFQHQISERSNSSIELVEYPKIYPTIYPSASGALWNKLSSNPENEDPELARKKRQLQELNESIARKRAIIAMEQKAKVIKKDYDPPSFLTDYDEDPTDESTWDPEIRAENTRKLDLKPKKSILKKRSEDQPQREMIATNQNRYSQDLLQGSKSPEEKCSASTTASNLPPIPTNSFNYFKNLIDSVSSSSCTRKTSHLQPISSTSHSQTTPFSQQDYNQASGTEKPSVHSSTVKPKSNLSKQMDRFLGALNKADSNLLSLLGEGASNSNVENQQQRWIDDKDPSNEELYDPFSATEDQEHSPFMESKECKIPMLGNFTDSMDDYGQEYLLPHERAVEDGSGFSRIVGMRYETQSKPEKLLGKQAIAFQGPSLQVHVSYPEESLKHDRDKESKRFRVEGSCSPVSQKPEHASEDRDDGGAQFKKLHDLLQTIGLSLDTAEVTKLADRTRERLYGKKANPQIKLSDSFDQKDKRSASMKDRRASDQSTDSDTGDHSLSHAKSPKREVYMSFTDTIKSRQDKGAVNERELVRSLTMTIRNSPEARPVSPDSYTTTVQATQQSPQGNESDCYSAIPQSLSLQFQSGGSLYSQTATEHVSAEYYNQASWGSSYALPSNQNQTSPVFMPPYDAHPQSSYYAQGYPSQHYHPPPGYGTYTPFDPFSMVPPRPVQHFPPPPSFSMPGPSGHHPNYSYLSFTNASDQLTKVKSPKTRCLTTIETKNLAKEKKATKRTALTSVEMKSETLPKDDKREPECPSGSTTEDATKGKLITRLEQFNQRMRLKKKLKMEAQKTNGQSKQSTPGQVTQTEVKNVWICGHSLIFWAKKRATSPEVGLQLGMDRNTVHIWWKGVQGMTWQQLLPQLLQLKDNWPKPDILFVHLGGNDIGKTSPDDFVEAVKNDFVSLKNIFPQCLLVWSDILPRKSWRHSEDSLEVNKTRDTINRRVHGIMEELDGYSLSHENIAPTLDPCLYRPDGVHLSGRGIDTFNLNIQDFLVTWESKTNETQSAEA